MLASPAGNCYLLRASLLRAECPRGLGEGGLGMADPLEGVSKRGTSSGAQHWFSRVGCAWSQAGSCGLACGICGGAAAQEPGMRAQGPPG